MANTPKIVFKSNTIVDAHYIQWLQDIKQRYLRCQVKASVRVNGELLAFYWSLGRDMVEQDIEHTYGASVMENLSLDLKASFPNQTGFSVENLYLIKRWYSFYNQPDTILYQFGTESKNILYQAGTDCEMPSIFGLIPWRHHVEIMRRCKTMEEASFYLQQTISNNWSRSTLENHLASNLYGTKGKAITNFDTRLPATESRLAQEILKDPYNFEFLTLRADYDERELEEALMNNITRFLLELGKGFAFVGRQMELRMPNGQSYFPDLVFYHIRLRSYVVVDLKAVPYKPEFAGKINFYVSAADELLRGEGDNPTIGLIICKESDKTIVEWSMRGIEQPLGVATYQLQEVIERTIKEIQPNEEEAK